MRLAALGLALLAAAAPAAPPGVDHIVWLNSDTLAVRVGGQLVRPAEQIASWLQAHLPAGVRLQPMVANTERSWALIRQGETACIASAVRLPEREYLAHFSTLWMMPPPQVIVRRERRSALPLDARGAVDLSALLADASLRGVIAQGRSYGAALDGQLSAGQRLVRVRGGDFGSNLLPMLMQDRADYTVEYPSVLVALASRQDAEPGLAALPIKGAGELIAAGVACPRTPWGLSALRLIDATFGTPEGAAMLREAMQATLPADTQRAYRDAFDIHFQRRSRPTPGL